MENMEGQALMEAIGVQAKPAGAGLRQSLPVVPRFVRIEPGRIKP
jgi:hypothetical protein